MSRIGRLVIPVPDGVDVALDGDTITVSGPRGTLARQLAATMRVVHASDRASFTV
jgi:large subunit ribosomal protein L6